MDTQSTLSIAAEIGIGIAGFSSIAAAISSRSPEGAASARWMQLRILLQSSFAVVLFAYLPMLLSAASLAESAIWVVASGIYVVWLVFLIGLALRRRAPPGFGGINVVLIAVFTLTSLALNLLNVLVVGSSWPFLAALACGLSVSFSQFVVLLKSLFVLGEHAA